LFCADCSQSNKWKSRAHIVGLTCDTPPDAEPPRRYAGRCLSYPHLRASDHLVGANVFPALFANHPVAVGAQAIDRRLHPRQQCFRRQRADTGALQCLDFLALPPNLGAHALDFRAGVLKMHGRYP
jgi:hypothetical protein